MIDPDETVVIEAGPNWLEFDLHVFVLPSARDPVALRELIGNIGEPDTLQLRQGGHAHHNAVFAVLQKPFGFFLFGCPRAFTDGRPLR